MATNVGVCEYCSLIFEEDYCPDCCCGNCGALVEPEYSGECEHCGLPVCEVCQAPYTQFSQIDYPLHKFCAELDRWN